MTAVTKSPKKNKKCAGPALALTSHQEGWWAEQSLPGYRACRPEARARETPIETLGETWSTSSPRARRPSRRENQTPLGGDEKATGAASIGPSARLKRHPQRGSCVQSHPSSTRRVIPTCCKRFCSVRDQATPASDTKRANDIGMIFGTQREKKADCEKVKREKRRKRRQPIIFAEEGITFRANHGKRDPMYSRNAIWRGVIENASLFCMDSTR